MSESTQGERLNDLTSRLLWLTAPFVAASSVFAWAVQETSSVFVVGFVTFAAFVSTFMLAVVGYDYLTEDDTR